VPVLEAKDSTKVMSESPTGVGRWTSYSADMKLLNSFEQGQSVIVKPVVIGTGDKWAISWKPFPLQKEA
jgi:hypothetical protein